MRPSTFFAKDGEIVTTGVPTGVLRTGRQYENYVLELDWKHVVPGGNSGLFVWSDAITAPGQPFTRAFECQILDKAYFTPDHPKKGLATGQGDLFAIHGSSFKPDRPHPAGWMRCLPSENRTKPAGQWNHYRVECNDGVIKLAVNGKVVSGGSGAEPRKGYICLEAEGAECHFRDIRIKELPSTHPRPDEVAKEDEGFKSIYTGVDLAGWSPDKGQEGHWGHKDWVLEYDGKAGPGAKAGGALRTDKEYGDFAIIVDWRLGGEPKKRKLPAQLPGGEAGEEKEVLDAGAGVVYFRGSEKAGVDLWCRPTGSGGVSGYATDATQPAEVRRPASRRSAPTNPPASGTGRSSRSRATACRSN